MAAAIIAYFAMCYSQVGWLHDSRAETKYVEAKYPESREEFDEAVEEWNSLVAKRMSTEQKYWWWRASGITLCGASFIAFIIGSGVSGWALLSKVGDTSPLQRKVQARGSLI